MKRRQAFSNFPRPCFMSIEQRRHTRFSLEIAAVIFTKYGERQETVLQQISVGGCFTGWEENIFAGDEFRMEIELPNKNRLPLACKAVYRFENTGVGVKFLDITDFEQSLVSQIITERLKAEGLPLHIDPFAQPAVVSAEVSRPKVTDERQARENMLEKIMAGNDEP
ncbi:MAG: PilZ domain-containing protein [Acidobacteriota bacterium]